MKPADRLSSEALLRAQTLGYSPAEVVRMARLARPITGDWWTHRYEDYLFRKGDQRIHAFDHEGANTEQKQISRHLAISARDSIIDLLTPETPQDVADNARWVLEEIRKELE